MLFYFNVKILQYITTRTTTLWCKKNTLIPDGSFHPVPVKGEQICGNTVYIFFFLKKKQQLVGQLAQDMFVMLNPDDASIAQT